MCLPRTNGNGPASVQTPARAHGFVGVGLGAVLADDAREAQDGGAPEQLAHVALVVLPPTERDISSLTLCLGPDGLAHVDDIWSSLLRRGDDAGVHAAL